MILTTWILCLPYLPYKIWGGRAARPSDHWLCGDGPLARPDGAEPPSPHDFWLREGTPATTGLGRVRVHEHESLLHQGFVVIERHPVQIDEGLRVHKNPHISKLKHTVALARLRIEPYVVSQARASAALHAQTKATLLRRNVFFHHG